MLPRSKIEISVTCFVGCQFDKRNRYLSKEWIRCEERCLGTLAKAFASRRVSTYRSIILTKFDDGITVPLDCFGRNSRVITQRIFAVGTSFYAPTAFSNRKRHPIHPIHFRNRIREWEKLLRISFVYDTEHVLGIIRKRKYGFLFSNECLITRKTN